MMKLLVEVAPSESANTELRSEIKINENMRLEKTTKGANTLYLASLRETYKDTEMPTGTLAVKHGVCDNGS